MSNFKDITGQKFGRLTALYRLHNTKGRTKWLCICDCGNLTIAISNNLLTGQHKSCGCYKIEKCKTLGKLNKTHGKTRDTNGKRLYNIWRGMKRRCYLQNDKSYPNYGGRGIAVCDKWRNNFQAFYDWAVYNGYREDLTIDRIDVNGDYEPCNCRWATAKEQDRNKRNNIYFTHNGVTRCLSEWCEVLGLNYNTVKWRISNKWSIERALELC